MTDLGFNHQIGKLKSVYGEKTFHPDRLKVVARSLKSLTDEDFQKICEDIIANSNTPPTLKDFLKVGQSLIYARNQEQSARDRKMLEEIPACYECHGFGYVFALKSRYEYSFQCPVHNCLAAKVYAPANYPKWSEDYSSEYVRNEK